jgi:putative hydrolase of the HAD superfamily
MERKTVTEMHSSRRVGHGLNAVTFDVGGTLIEPWPSVGHIYAQAARVHIDERFSPELLQQRFVAAWRGSKTFNYTRLEWARLVDETFFGLTRQPPSETFFPVLYDQFAKPELWRVFPDVVPTLESLARRGLHLGIISNWDERLRPLLAQLKLDLYFNKVVISCEIGCCKPDRGIFEAASNQLGIPASEILHVGDSDLNDTQGARDAGFQAALLIRSSKAQKAGQIRSLLQLASGVLALQI